MRKKYVGLIQQLEHSILVLNLQKNDSKIVHNSQTLQFLAP